MHALPSQYCLHVTIIIWRVGGGGYHDSWPPQMQNSVHTYASPQQREGTSIHVLARLR